jgi:hypothetical protein
MTQTQIETIDNYDVSVSYDRDMVSFNLDNLDKNP